MLESKFENLANDPRWQRTVLDWLKQELNKLGLQLQGHPDLVQSRPWSIVLRVPAGSELFFFKASSANLIHEAKFTAWLHKRAPDMVADVVAIDHQAGWLLQRSAGRRMRQVVSNSGLVERWTRLLPAYGRLQKVCVQHFDELLAMGLPDRRLATLPAHVNRWRQIIQQAQGRWNLLTAAEFHQLEEVQLELASTCNQLKALGPKPTINHGDLHDGNVGISGEKYSIYDWGDVSLSHPFFSLRSTFVSLENRLGVPPESAELDQLAQKYLTVWSADRAASSLGKSLELASKIWSIGTALSWEAALGSFEQSFGGEYGGVLPSLLRELLLAFGGTIEGDL